MTDPEDTPSEGDRMPRRHVQFTEEIDPESSIVSSDDGLVAWLRDEFGDALRVVGVYDSYTFELLSVADEVRDQYSEREFAATGDEFVLSGTKEDPYQERLYRLGGVEYVSTGFEEGQVIRIPLEEGRGLVVSVDSGTDVPLPGFVRRLDERHDVELR